MPEFENPDAPSEQPALTRRAQRRAERAAQLEEELAAHTSARRARAMAVTGQVPIGTVALPAQPAKEPEPRELLSAAAAGSPEHPSRAGRNLPVAVGVGVGLGAVLVLSLFIRKEIFLGLAVIACAAALWELDRALRTRDIRLPLLPLLVGTVGMLVTAYSAGIEALLVAFLLTAGGVVVWRVLDGGGVVALREATTGIFAAAYIPFLAGFLTIMLSADDGPWRVLLVVALVVANDVGGYTAGVLFGRHPMAPTVSPKKSWEGAAGSLVVAIAVGIVFAALVFDLSWWTGAVLGVAAVCGAVIGDLAESLLKRDLGVKDMGTILPGHGGVLDRVDSTLLAAPVVFAMLLVFAPA
ncbi:phosphatidate cytidylyltransferase [Ruania halotolerans]|uniref:phosphatidate cytidylyltransferase n=1 Tax=Ruania halotolerans TaxID=2897773 RepID=UPI00338E102B